MKKPELTKQILRLYIGRPCDIFEYGSEFLGDSVKCTHAHLLNKEGFSITPHLRRLESITEEECREVYKINFEQEFDKPFYCKEVWWASQRAYQDFDVIGNPAAWLYLLSLGFDLFGLIDNGLAKEVSE